MAAGRGTARREAPVGLRKHKMPKIKVNQISGVSALSPNIPNFENNKGVADRWVR